MFLIGGPRAVVMPNSSWDPGSGNLHRTACECLLRGSIKIDELHTCVLYLVALEGYVKISSLP